MEPLTLNLKVTETSCIEENVLRQGQPLGSPPVMAGNPCGKGAFITMTAVLLPGPTIFSCETLTSFQEGLTPSHHLHRAPKKKKPNTFCLGTVHPTSFFLFLGWHTDAPLLFSSLVGSS